MTVLGGDAARTRRAGPVRPRRRGAPAGPPRTPAARPPGPPPPPARPCAGSCARLLAAGAIDATTHDADRALYDRAAGLRRTLTGARKAELPARCARWRGSPRAGR